MALRILLANEPNFAEAFAALRPRGVLDPKVERAARRIVDAVRARGDAAVLEAAARFDGVRLSSAEELLVPKADLERALRAIPRAARQALEQAAARIARFHRHQRDRSWQFRDRLGFTLGQRVFPLDRAGVYVPGGHAVYPSSVLMNVIPARVAGVREIVMATPSGPEGPAAAVLAAAAIAGVDRVYRVGGAQAVAALAFGTETIPKVDKIVGPGNAWVQAAKRLVFGVVDIDGIAGPSEVVVVADEHADPSYVAADLLAQAEHGSGDECALLFTPCRALALATQAEVEAQLRALPRRQAIARVLARRAAAIVVGDIEQAIALADAVAPEHLELIVRNPKQWLDKIRHAGAVFVGPWAPAPLGDYAAGPNHVLPTGGTARFFSPLGVYDFVKRSSIVQANRSALEHLAPVVTTLAELEGYEAHANAVRVRLSACPLHERKERRHGR
ncbi:MAG: histidinol dehydrogenase [Candidatus Binatia bacterium]|nr:MAG: histidinol dehydrogenase [Candidatus Binatia bacterium]